MKQQLLASLLILSLLASCTPTPTAAPTAHPTGTTRPTATATATTAPTATLTPTRTPAPTSTPLPTDIPTPTPTPTPVPISAQSAAQVVELANYGSGSMAEIVLSPDGKTIAIAGTLGVWLVDAQTYEKLRLLKGPTDLETNGRAELAWSPDGVYVASTGKNSLIWVWEANTGQIAHVLNGQVAIGEIDRLCWSPDGRWLATLIGEWLLVWDLDGEVVRLAFHGYREPHPPFPSNPGYLEGFDWSPDGPQLATITWNGYVQLWDAVTGEELRRIKLGSEVHTEDLAWSPDGQMLAVSDWTETGPTNSSYRVRLLSAQSLETLRTFTLPEIWARTLHWSPDGKYLAAASWYASVWDVQSGSLVFDVTDPDYALAGQSTLFWSQDGSRIITRCRENGFMLCTWDLATEALLEKSPVLFGGKTYSVAWSPDGETLAVGSEYGPARLLDADTGAFLQAAPEQMGNARIVSWSPDGQRLLTSDQYWMSAWDLQSVEVVTQVVAVLSPAISWSPDGTRWAAGYSGGIRFWGPEWEEMQIVEDLWALSVNAAAWSPDGQWIAVGGQGYSSYSGRGTRGTLHLYNPFTQEDIVLSDLNESDSTYVGALAWSNDGNYLATGCNRGAGAGFVVQIWDTRQLGSSESIPLVAELPGHSSWITSLAWSADGSMLASGDHEGRILLWPVQTLLSGAVGISATSLTGHGGDVEDLDWSPDGLRLASAGEDGTLRIWGVPQVSAAALAEIGLPEQAEFPAEALPGDLPVVTAENGADLQLLTALGNGTVTDLALSPDGHFVALASTHGVWIYDAETLAALHWLSFPNNGMVQSLAWSPDGGWLAVRGRSGWMYYGEGNLQVMVWETKTWHLQSVLGPVLSNEWLIQYTLNLAWSPDGKWLAAADDRHLYIWDVVSGSLLSDWQTDAGAFASPQSALAWLPADAHYPRGRIVVGGGDNYGVGNLLVWDAASGALLQNEPLPPRPDGYDFSLPVSLALSPDGRSVVLIGGTDGMQMWREDEGGLAYDASFSPPQGEFSDTWDVEWSPDGKTILVAGKGWIEGGSWGTLWLLDAGSGEVLLRLNPHPSDMLAVAWLPSSESEEGRQRFVSAEQDGYLRLWEISTDAASAELLQSAPASSSALLAAAWSADGGHLTTISDLGVLRVWDVASGELLAVQEAFPQGALRVEGAAFSPQGDRVAIGMYESVQIWQVEPWQMLLEIHSEAASNPIPPALPQSALYYFAPLAWSPDGLYLAAVAFTFTEAGSPQYVLAVWELASGELRLQEEVGPDQARAIAWSPDGEIIAVGDMGERLRLWGVGEALAFGQDSASLWGSFVYPRDNNFGALAWSPDSQQLAAGANRIADPEYLAVFNRYGGLQYSIDTEFYQGGFNCLGWSPNGGLVATAGFEGGVMGVWESRTWGQVGGRYFGAHAKPESRWDIVTALVWSPDGRLLASLGADGVVRIWGAP